MGVPHLPAKVDLPFSPFSLLWGSRHIHRHQWHHVQSKAGQQKYHRAIKKCFLSRINCKSSFHMLMLAKGKVLTSDTKFNEGEFESMQKLARF